MEPRNEQSGVPTLSKEAEGHTRGGAIASRLGTPRGQRTQARTRISPCARTGRSRGRPCWLVMPRPGWFAGWQTGSAAGREGNAVAVSPR